MKIIFAATPEFALPALRELLAVPCYKICAIYTKPDSLAGRGQKLTASPIKKFVLDNNLQMPLCQPENFRTIEAQEQLRQFAADVFIDAAYGIILPDEVLYAARFGCINIHPSLLPRWRGAAPIQRAILEGDTQTGVTIMQMDSGLDTGAIIKQEAMPIEEHDTTASLYPKLAELGAKLLLKTLDELHHLKDTEKLNTIPQDNNYSSYAKKLSKEEAMIDWQQSAVRIERMIRAFNPYPIAFSVIESKIVRIWEGHVLQNTYNEKMGTTAFPVGTIIHVEKHGIDVVTGCGILRIEKLQLAGGKVLSAKDVINAKHKFFVIGKQFNGVVVNQI